MGRILEALKRIEARRGAGPTASPDAAPEALPRDAAASPPPDAEPTGQGRGEPGAAALVSQESVDHGERSASPECGIAPSGVADVQEALPPDIPANVPEEPHAPAEDPASDTWDPVSVRETIVLAPPSSADEESPVPSEAHASPAPSPPDEAAAPSPRHAPPAAAMMDVSSEMPGGEEQAARAPDAEGPPPPQASAASEPGQAEPAGGENGRQPTGGGEVPERGFQEAIADLLARQNAGGAEEAAYCELAANILSRLPPEPRAVVLFVGVGGEAGTSPAVAHLAAILGETIRGRVLAVEGRSRNPELGACFGIAARRGLAEVLHGTVRWQDAVRATPIANLHVLPGSEGRTARWPASDAGTLQALFLEFRRQYTLVLIDGGALDTRDAGVLPALADGVFLVAQIGSTPREAVAEAIKAIDAAGGHVLGCVAAEMAEPAGR